MGDLTGAVAGECAEEQTVYLMDAGKQKDSKEGAGILI